MRTLSVVFVVLLSSAVLPMPAFGVCPDPPQESPLAPGEVGLFFDAAGTVTCADPPLFTPFTVYLVARAPAGGIGAYSIPWVGVRSLPAGGMLVPDPAPFQLPVPSAFETGLTADWCNQAIPLEPGCALQEGELVVLGVGSWTRFSSAGGTARFETQCPTFTGQRAEPVWYEACGSSEPLALSGGDRLVLGFGEAPVPTAIQTWSTLKGRYPRRE